MSKLSMGSLTVNDAGEGKVNLPLAMVGAVGGALAMGVVYGVLGRFIGEYAYIAFLIGGASGIGAMKLGGGRSMVAGVVAAVASLIAVLGAKVIIGSPEGTSLIAYHTTMFDIIFCYVANPVAAFFAAGTDQARAVLDRLPI
ncbi:MAG: hypothetical protein JRH11_11685 [Deltaproteobacteria bacterium]|nr:hypothetical protein [Deltaproteobacteria bacterium]